MLSRKRSILLGVSSVFFLFVCLWTLSESGAWLFSGRIREDERGVEEVSYQVTRSVDGDTIELEDGRKVRYIGINAPETVDPRRKVECFGREASDFNAVTDSGIRNILINHLKANDNNPKLAFSPDGIIRMNQNLKELNGGKDHKPILKVRIS